MPTLTPLPEPEAITLLEKNHLPYPENGYAKSADEAVEIANKIGYPVVLKIVSHEVIHKSDVGGVKINLQNPQDVYNAFIDIEKALQEHIPDAKFDGTLLCKQATSGIELIVGGMRDVMFGPCLMVGLGGIFAEILKDVSFRIVPFSKIDAIEMLQELKGYSVLTGVRGGEKANIDTLAEFLVRISTFLYENSWIQELDFNPVRISGNNITILDARILH
jgi:acyl-CoA synthetase (NDP forming)